MPPKAAFYAIARGKETGVFNTWAETKARIDGYPGARYKKFDSKSQAEAFVKGNGSVILGQLGVQMETLSLMEPIIPTSFHSPPVSNGQSSTPVTVSTSASASSSLQSMSLSPSNASSPHASDTIVAFTDGSSLNNGKKNARAGYAIVFPNHPHFNTSSPLRGPNPTNNRAEYMAMLECLDIVEKKIDKTGARKVVLYTDSKILLQSITKWMRGWKKNGWKKADGKPVLNKDLLEAIDEKMLRRRVEMHHVLAHTGRDDWKSQWNDLVDKMARAAALKDA